MGGIDISPVILILIIIFIRYCIVALHLRTSSDVASRPWTPAADGIVVSVRLTPKGGRDSIDGVDTLADGTPC